MTMGSSDEEVLGARDLLQSQRRQFEQYLCDKMSTPNGVAEWKQQVCFWFVHSFPLRPPQVLLLRTAVSAHIEDAVKM